MRVLRIKRRVLSDLIVQVEDAGVRPGVTAVRQPSLAGRRQTGHEDRQTIGTRAVGGGVRGKGSCVVRPRRACATRTSLSGGGLRRRRCAVADVAPQPEAAAPTRRIPRSQRRQAAAPPASQHSQLSQSTSARGAGAGGGRETFFTLLFWYDLYYYTREMAW